MNIDLRIKDEVSYDASVVLTNIFIPKFCESRPRALRGASKLVRVEPPHRSGSKTFEKLYSYFILYVSLTALNKTYLLENSLNKHKAWSVLERSWGVPALAVQFTQASLWPGQGVVVRLTLVVVQASLSAGKRVVSLGRVEGIAWEGVVQLLWTAERVARLLGRKW